jgi:hypothetical protein
MALQLVPYHYAVRLHLAWSLFFYWYIVFANGPLERHKETTFYQFMQEKISGDHHRLLKKTFPKFLKVITVLHLIAFFPAVWFAWPYHASKWIAYDLAHVTMRYWFPLWLRWSIRKKSPQQIAEWRDSHLAKLANMAGVL